MAFSAPDTDISPLKLGFSVPESDLPNGGFHAPQSDLWNIDPGTKLGIPTEFSGGEENKFSPDNPDAAFTRATEADPTGALAGLAVGAIQNGLIEPAAAKLMNLAMFNLPAQPGEDSVAPAMPPIQPGVPLIPPPDGKGVLPALGRFASNFTTPGQLLTLPLAPESDLIKGFFATGAAAGIQPALEKFEQSQTPEDRNDAATELGLNVGMAALLGHGLGREHAAPVEQAPSSSEKETPINNQDATGAAPGKQAPSSSDKETPRNNQEATGAAPGEQAIADQGAQSINQAAESAFSPPNEVKAAEMAANPNAFTTKADLAAAIADLKSHIDANRLTKPPGEAVQPSEAPPGVPTPPADKTPVMANQTPLGLNRPVVANPDLAKMSAPEFDLHYRQATEAVDAVEKAMDQGNPPPRDQIAAAQDAYSAANLESYRRNVTDMAPEDLFDELRNLAPNAVKFGKDSEDYQQSMLLMDELERQGATKEDILNQVHLSSPDAAEVFAGDLGDIKTQAQQRVAKPPVPITSNLEPVPQSVQPPTSREVEWRTVERRSYSDNWESTLANIGGVPVEFSMNGDKVRIKSESPSVQNNFDRTHDFTVDFDKSGNIAFEKGNIPPSARAEILKEGARIAGNKPPIEGDTYLRYGNFPKSGQSKNHVTGQMEKGVSVYRAKWNPALSTFELADANHPGTAMDLIGQGKNPMLVHGENIGRGSDGEPVLKNPSKIADLKYTGKGYSLIPSRRPGAAAKEGNQVENAPIQGKPTGETPEVKPVGWTDERWKIFQKQRQAAVDIQKQREADYVPPVSKTAKGKPIDTPASATDKAADPAEAKHQTELPGTETPISRGPGMVDLGASTPEMNGKPTKTVGAGADIHGIAQRVRDARAQAGVASPVPTGEGWNVQEAIDWGRQLKKEGADPEKSLSDFEKTGAISPDAAALIRAHGEDLAKVARNIEEKFGTDSEEYRVAQKASDSWEQRTKPIGTAWHKIGVVHQGETDLDTGSVSEMARAHKKATGNDFTAEQVKKATEIAEQSKKATQEAQDALRKAQDELSKAQVPKYPSYIINVAERIVARLDTAADAARARVKARLGRVSAGIDPEMLSDAAIIGASHIAHIGLDFAKWSDAMVKELGDTIKPHLQDIFAKSQKQVDDLADSMGGKEGATVKQAVRKTPAPKTPTERVFDAAKKEIEAGSQDMGDLRNKLAIDLGMTPREVAEHLAKNQTVKRATDEAYLKQARARQLKNSAKAWLKDQQSPVWQRYASKIPRALFGLKVAGHATVGIGTHAAQNLFIPSRWPAIARAYVDMWRFAYGKAATHEAAMEDLTRRPNFPVARRGGLVNDPYTSQGDYQSPENTHWSRMLRAGNLAFDALKELRQDLFDLHWNKLPAHMKTPEMAKAISDMMDHATGTTRRAVSESNWKNLVFFAPRLVGSRLAWEIADPVKAVYYGLKGKSATPAERHFALSQLKEKSAFLGVYLGALAVNQGILQATGSKQRVNMSDPSKADWLRFKGAGYQAAPFSSGIFAIRQFARLLHDLRGTRTPFEQLEGNRQSEAAGHLMQYARGELSPAAGYLADQISQQDFMGRNLPLSDEKDKNWMKEHGYGRYTWGQYATQALTPIPVEEPVMEVWKHWGMPDATASFWMKTLLEAGARATTGIYFGEDQSYGNK